MDPQPGSIDLLGNDAMGNEAQGAPDQDERINAGFLDDDDLKTTLLTCIDGFSNTGHFAAKGVLGSANPGLEVTGLGRFGIPLAERDIHQLISAAGQAPYGKGSETIIDTSVRRTWEIDGSRVQLRHPGWAAQQKQVLEDVCTQLGIPGGATYVQAQLYKLLIYEPGAMFKPHKDTEKAPRMFGTLAVTLPCVHTGGELCLSFNGQKEVYSSAAEAEWSSPYFAWFADVLHEVKPVLSGYRVVLTYTLVHSGPMATPGLLNQDAQRSSLSAVLRRWKTETDKRDLTPNWLIYRLEHEYTEAHLSFNHLKGNDRSRTEAIVAACNETDFICYVCTMEKMVDGGVEDDGYYGHGRYGRYDDADHHEIFDICDESLKLLKVVDVDGKVVMSDVSIEESDIIQSDIFEDRDPDSEECEVWTGNEGASATH